jgi:hypothetical protein
LEALYRVNPVEQLGFDEVVDFPAKLTRRRKDSGSEDQIPVVVATFRYDEQEIEQIEADLGPGALHSPDFTVTIGYRDRSKTFGHRYNETAIVKHLHSALDLPSAAAATVNATSTVAELLNAIDGLEEPTSAATALAQRIRDWRNQDVRYYLIDQYSLPLMPKFVYFGEYDVMPGKVSIPDFIRRRDTYTLNRGELALLSLLDMAGVSLEDFQRTDRHERLIRELENSGNVISDEVFDYWSQNTDLEVQLEVLPVEDNAVAPLNDAPILQIRVGNQRHKVSVPFDDRSRGFVWFFIFLAYFNKLEEAKDTDLILAARRARLVLAWARRTCSRSSTSGWHRSTRSSTRPTRHSWCHPSTCNASAPWSTRTRSAPRSRLTSSRPTPTQRFRCSLRWASR